LQRSSDFLGDHLSFLKHWEPQLYIRIRYLIIWEPWWSNLRTSLIPGKGLVQCPNNRPTLYSYQTASRGMRERFGQKLIP
jgi:hypothetical protein